jgi:DNA-directed RNA polymerase subunit RPC12/RpoP
MVSYGTWDCPNCDNVVESDISYSGMQCEECGAVVVE